MQGLLSNLCRHLANAFSFCIWAREVILKLISLLIIESFVLIIKPVKRLKLAFRDLSSLRILDLEQYNAIYAYGNSYEDEPMLNLATYPYMVGTDQVLPEVTLYKKLA